MIHPVLVCAILSFGMHQRISISHLNASSQRKSFKYYVRLPFTVFTRSNTVLNRYNVWSYYTANTSLLFVASHFFHSLSLSSMGAQARTHSQLPCMLHTEQHIQFNKNSCCIAMYYSSIINASIGQCYALDDINCSILRDSESILPFHRFANEIQTE